MPKLAVMIVGKKSEAIAPIKVPTFQEVYITQFIPMKYAIVHLSSFSVVKIAKDSSVTPKPAINFCVKVECLMRSKTQVLMIKCLKFKRKVAKTIAIMLAPCSYIPTAIIWLAPAKTLRDIPQV